MPLILPWFTFRETHHSHATWMAEDGIPEVARRARLGQKMKGIARTYDHVTEVMLNQIGQALEARRLASLPALDRHELARILGWFPHLGTVVEAARALPSERPIAIDLARHAGSPASRSSTGLLTCVVRLWTILGLNQ